LGSLTARALSGAKRIVIKVGSALVADMAAGRARAEWLAGFAVDIAALRARKVEVLIVSSGAVALGRKALDLPPQRKLRLEEKQAAAAAGQPVLMAAWGAALSAHDIAAAQALLTASDTEARRRWLNARLTLNTLLRLGAVPIINENDTVATEEIRVGDNDRLAARVAQMIGADLLVLLSDVDGLYSGDPRKDANARHIDVVEALTPEILAMAGAANAAAGVGTGGMATKLEAARIAASAGCATIIANGTVSRPVDALRQGARSTLLKAATAPSAAYKAWIAGTIQPRGVLMLDAGAVAAIRAGRSLLPSGVKSIEGAFEKGDVVSLSGPEGNAFARGLVAYDAPDAVRIVGVKSDAIEGILGWDGGPNLVHADDLVVI
jgi:glutamate 5-kinase